MLIGCLCLSTGRLLQRVLLTQFIPSIDPLLDCIFWAIPLPTAGATGHPQPQRKVRREHQKAWARPHWEGGGAPGRGPPEQGPHRFLRVCRRGEQHSAGVADVPDVSAQFRVGG